jgi:hypothetical protein
LLIDPAADDPHANAIDSMKRNVSGLKDLAANQFQPALAGTSSSPSSIDGSFPIRLYCITEKKLV